MGEICDFKSKVFKGRVGFSLSNYISAPHITFDPKDLVFKVLFKLNFEDYDKVEVQSYVYMTNGETSIYLNHLEHIKENCIVTVEGLSCSISDRLVTAKKVIYEDEIIFKHDITNYDEIF